MSCVLFGFNKEKKYSGSYEHIAKAIAKISTQKEQDLRSFFKMTVLNYLLKNGDAHLKNFGVQKFVKILDFSLSENFTK